MTDISHLLEHLRTQAKGCRALGSPFTASLCQAMADDLETGGPTSNIIADWPTGPRKDALAMRLCGALHHAVLSGDAPDLAEAYPEDRSDWSIDEVWPLAQSYLSSEVETVRSFIGSPPQTNETRRSIALLPGFLEIAARFDMPLNILELGASVGLNQNWDKFTYQTESWERSGDSDVIVDTDWRGAPPDNIKQSIQVTERAACDQNPLDIHDPKQATQLRSYIWADQPDRLARFDAAVKLAQECRVRVDKQDAAVWLKKKLLERPPNTTTIIFHSVFLQYPPKETIQEIIRTIETAGSAATSDAPLAWLCFEPEGLFGGPRSSPVMLTRLKTWPGGEIKLLARSDGHATFVESVQG